MLRQHRRAGRGRAVSRDRLAREAAGELSATARNAFLLRSTPMNPAKLCRPALLTVDDDLGVRESYALLFDEWMDVVGAERAASALAAARQRLFNAIVLDVRMPRVSGLEMFDELRALQPGVPIIFVTAVNTAETAIAAIRLGAFDYVTKPFDIDHLVATVRRALAASAGMVSIVGR